MIWITKSSTKRSLDLVILAGKSLAFILSAVTSNRPLSCCLMSASAILRQWGFYINKN